MSAKWHILRLSHANPRHPPLLVSHNFTPDSYTIYLTDLTRIWSEGLDRRSIIKRSFDLDTSIDPSESAEQLRVLLQKLRGALAGNNDANISLRTAATDDVAKSQNITGLILTITATLPKPLRPLVWPLDLHPGEPSALMTQFTLPILQTEALRAKEVEQLIERLKEKDHVIQKLVDKLEASAIELHHVFPIGAPKGIRKSARAVADEKVKGLTEFDQDIWRLEACHDASQARDAKRAIVHLFSSQLESSIDDKIWIEPPKSWDRWWTSGLPDTVDEKDTEYQDDSPTSAQNEVRTSILSKNGADNEAFQVQATPSPPRETSGGGQGESDNVNKDIESQLSRVLDSFPGPQSTTNVSKQRKIGIICGSKRASATKISTQDLLPERYKNHNDAQSVNSKASEVLETIEDYPRQVATPKRLGRIGGNIIAKRKSSIQPQDELHGSGVGQYQKRGDDSQVLKDEASPRERSARDLTTSHDRESSMDRADRKREELKKALDDKAKVPVRKKRKF